MGLPIGDIVLATNANLTVTDYLTGGVWRPRPSVATLASAMDVGDPSNMERLRSGVEAVEQLRERVTAYSVTDDQIRATIREDARTRDRVWCPHSATAAYVYRERASARPDEHWVIVATAHPAKFDEIVEPLIGRSVPVPPVTRSPAPPATTRRRSRIRHSTRCATPWTQSSSSPAVRTLRPSRPR